MARELIVRCSCGRRLPNSQVMVSHNGRVTCDACDSGPDIGAMEREEAERLDGIEHERELREAADGGMPGSVATDYQQEASNPFGARAW